MVFSKDDKEIKKYNELRIKARKDYEEMFKLKQGEEKLEQIRFEKKKVNIELEICKAPFFSILITVGVSILSPFLAVGFTHMLDDNKIIQPKYERGIILIIIAIYTLLIIVVFSKTIIKNQYNFKKYLVCKDVLEEMELEELESDDINNDSTIHNELENIKNEMKEIKEFFGIRK